MNKKPRLFRVKKQKKPRIHANFKPETSTWQEIAPISASLLATDVTEVDAFCTALDIHPYRIDQNTVCLAHTDTVHADANSMLHELLDGLLPKTELLCLQMQQHAISYCLRLSFGEAEPPSLVILDGNLCRFLFEIKAKRDPDFAIF